MSKSVDTSLPAPQGYIPVLDGVRAVAIGGVLLFHGQVPSAALGWAGVNLFFVLSGFLITGILLDAKTGNRYFRNFYARRTLRIFPIYYAVLLSAIAVSIVKGNARGDYTLWHLSYMQNWIQVHDRFNSPLFGSLGHTWSLAVEEQFYLLWPLLVYFSSKRTLKIIIGSLLLLTPMVRLVFWAATDNVFYQNALLITQVDALAFGSLVACLKRSGLESRAFHVYGRLAMIVGSMGVVSLCIYFGYPTAFWFPKGYLTSPLGSLLYSFLGLLFAGWIASLVVPGQAEVRAGRLWSFQRKVLESGFMRQIGKISYGIYLFHPLVWVYWEKAAGRLRILDPGAGAAAWLLDLCIKLVLVYAVAYVSFRYFEAPIMSLKKRFPTLGEAAGKKVGEGETVRFWART